MSLSEARAALASCEWSRAAELFAVAECTDPVDEADRLDALAEAQWWLGRIEACIEARQQAYALYEANDACRRAGQTAVWLYEHQCFQGRPAMAGGWLRRARRALEGDEESVAFGNLLLREAEQFHGAGDLDTALDQATTTLELARRLRSTDLEAEALQTMGRLRVDQGDHRVGLGDLDEAMLLAVEGRLGPYATGKVYCSLIGACQDVGDLRRAAEWTEAAGRWADNHPFAVFPGLCRVKRAEMLQLRGDWAQAEEEARLACRELASVNVSSAAAAWVEVGEIRRRTGDLAGAEEAFRHADELCCTPTAGLALLRLAQGRSDEAAAIIGDALADPNAPALARAKVLPAAIEVAVAMRRLDDACVAADELERTAAAYATEALRAQAAVTRGRVQLAGQDAAAAGSLRRSIELWQALDIPYEAASAQLLLAQACRLTGDHPAADAALTSAITTFDRLGAAYDATGARRSSAADAAPAGLTERELEVLRLVARGNTNKDIARQLVLADKTVARHLSNIFTKTGVATRSAATAFAFESGIVAGAG